MGPWPHGPMGPWAQGPMGPEPRARAQGPGGQLWSCHYPRTPRFELTLWPTLMSYSHISTPRAAETHNSNPTQHKLKAPSAHRLAHSQNTIKQTFTILATENVLMYVCMHTHVYSCIWLHSYIHLYIYIYIYISVTYALRRWLFQQFTIKNQSRNDL